MTRWESYFAAFAVLALTLCAFFAVGMLVYVTWPYGPPVIAVFALAVHALARYLQKEF